MEDNRHKEKASEFLQRYTKIHEPTGKSYIDATEALIELYSRVQSALSAIKEQNTALGDCAVYMEQMDNRIKELEGKKTIEVISPDQAKIILK